MDDYTNLWSIFGCENWSKISLNNDMNFNKIQSTFDTFLPLHHNMHNVRELEIQV